MDVASKMSKMIEDTISEALIKAVQNLSIEIDEEELLKRLRDSKEIYKRGYEDREQEIVRCRDCKYWKNGYMNFDVHPWLPCMEIETNSGWFCGSGKRREVE